MSRYQPVFEERFVRNRQRYRSLRKHIQRHVDQILDDPYTGTERLGRIPGRQDLRGCRSVRVTRNFRIIFIVCEECRQMPECQFCFCEGRRTRPWSSSPSAHTSGPTPCERKQ